MKSCEKRRGKPTPAAIKEGMDNLPSGIAFARPNGIVILCNHAMHALSHAVQGESLQNAEAFWQAVLSKSGHVDGSVCTLSLENGEVWLLRRTSIELENKPIYELVAQNVTELHALNECLRKDNERLAALAARLHRYSEEALELTRKRELLARKTRTHDELGRLLMETRHYLESGDDAELDTLWARWHLNAGLMREESRLIEQTDLHEQLCSAAKAVGVQLTVIGEPLRCGMAAELLFAAGGESLTNLLRHAHGDELHIRIERRGDEYNIRITNNGNAPEGEIVEGGGLTALRRRVEDAGGAMQIISQPEFTLLLNIPERSDNTDV